MTPLGALILGAVLTAIGAFLLGLGASGVSALILAAGICLLGYALYDFLTFDKDD